MAKCSVCGKDYEEFYEWKFEYGLKKMKIMRCMECGQRVSAGLVEL